MKVKSQLHHYIYFIRTIAICIICISISITSPTDAQAQKQRPKVGLVLSGGGAKGVAHIGALKVIEELNIPIDYICGTSMGAIVGGLYSIGYSAEELDSIVKAQDWMLLFSDRIDRTHQSYQEKLQNDIYLLSIPFNHNQKLKISQPTGIMKGQSILNKFSDLTLGYHDCTSFYNLPIPFTCIASDLISGKEVILDKGSLPLAMRTSMSVPGFFEPVRKDSLIMIDGGVLNNFPVDVVKAMGADITIGIDLNNDDTTEAQYSSLFDIANRIAFLSGENKYSQNKKIVDLYIHPDLKGFESVDFKPSAIDSMISKGEIAARKEWNNLVHLKRNLKLKGNKQYHDNLIKVTDSLHIDSMHIIGLSSYNGNWLQKKVGFTNNSTYVHKDIENMLLTLQGLGIFKTVSYKIVHGNEQKNSIIVYVEEKARGSINIGMHLDTEDVASALIQAQIGLGEKNEHNISATTKINQNPWFNLRYSRSNSKIRNFSLTYNLSYKDFRLKKEGNRLYNINFLRNHFKASYRDDSFRKFKYEMGVHYDIYNNVSDLFTPDYVQYKSKDEGYSAAYFKMDFDSSDDRENPTRGVYMTTSFDIYGSDLLKNEKNYFGTVSFGIEAAIPINRRFCVLPELYGRAIIGHNIPGYFCNYIGGEYNYRYVSGQHAFYGIHFTEIMDNTMLGIKCALRYQIAKKQYISCIGNILFNSHHIKDLFSTENHTGGALKYTYNSMIGPISLSLDYSSRSKEIGIFAGVGYFF